MPSRRGFVGFLLGLPFPLALGACGRHRDAPIAAEQPSKPAPARPEPEPAPPNDLEAHVDQLRARFESRGWAVVAEPPFAVVGDGGPRVEALAAGTIRWAVTHLEAAYFEAAPEHVITIYLFETAQSYERHALELFGEAPDTPYGYYSPSDRALVMNIATGGGTLVHEIVHPYMAANFPSCPSWFDEGLASLYEQSAERNGEIIGLTNWRLAGLQDALRAKAVPSFEQLCESGRGFYTDDPGSNYGQARYLCYWLQELGLLRYFYREFRSRAASDPSGYATLASYVGPDMDAFRSRWEQFVLGLRFPE
jgi:hypothetical protein